MLKQWEKKTAILNFTLSRTLQAEVLNVLDSNWENMPMIFGRKPLTLPLPQMKIIGKEMLPTF